MYPKLLVLLTAASLLAAAPAALADVSLENDGFRLDFEGDTLVVEGGGHGEEVEITADLELYVDGRRIETDRGDRRLLKDYYAQAEEIVAVAEDLGREGALLGARGAAVGVRAVGRVLRLLDKDYDAEDLEADIERDTEKIEFEAEKIEQAGERLEEQIDDLRGIGDRLQERIDDLDRLDWF